MRFSSCGVTIVAKAQGCHGKTSDLEWDNLLCLHTGYSLQDSLSGAPDWPVGAKGWAKSVKSNHLKYYGGLNFKVKSKC